MTESSRRESCRGSGAVLPCIAVTALQAKHKGSYATVFKNFSLSPHLYPYGSPFPPLKKKKKVIATFYLTILTFS